MTIGRTSFDLKSRELTIEVDGRRQTVVLPEFLSTARALEIAHESSNWEEFAGRIRRIATADEAR